MAKHRDPQAFDFEGVCLASVATRIVTLHLPLSIPVGTVDQCRRSDGPSVSYPGNEAWSRVAEPCPASVGYGRVANPALVAGFFADFFPNCMLVWSAWNVESRSNQTKWSEVRELLPQFVRVRFQKRHGAAAAGMRIRGPAKLDAVLRYVDTWSRDSLGAARVAQEGSRWCVPNFVFLLSLAHEQLADAHGLHRLISSNLAYKILGYDQIEKPECARRR